MFRTRLLGPSRRRALLILTLLAGACAPAAEESPPVTTFMDEQGRPLANLRVTFWADGRARAFDTDSEGRVAVELERGVYDVVARKERPWPWNLHGPDPRWSREDVVWRAFDSQLHTIRLPQETPAEAQPLEPALYLIADSAPGVRTAGSSGE